MIGKKLLVLLRTILIMLTIFLVTPASAEPENKIDHNYLSNSVSLQYLFSHNLSNHYIQQNSNFVNYVTMKNWDHVPGASAVKLVGIHDLLLGLVKRRVKHQAQDDLRIEFNLSNMRENEFYSRMNVINSEYNPYGDWWNRPWFYSLPPKNGGAPKIPIVQKIGWDIRITDDVPVVGFVKQQFDKLGDIWINIDNEFDEERGQSPKRNDGKVDNDYKKHAKLNTQIDETNIGIDKQWRWFESSFYHFRFKPTIKFKTTDVMFIDEVALQVQTELYLGERKHFATISFFVRHNIADKNTFFSVFIGLVNF